MVLDTTLFHGGFQPIIYGVRIYSLGPDSALIQNNRGATCFAICRAGSSAAVASSAVSVLVIVLRYTRRPCEPTLARATELPEKALGQTTLGVKPGRKTDHARPLSVAGTYCPNGPWCKFDPTRGVMNRHPCGRPYVGVRVY